MVQVQLFNVYAPKYDTGGKFWPIVHNTTIFSLVVLHIIAIGVFGLKKLPLASSLLLPLPVLTLLFNEFCRNRFVPIFEAYSTEVTVPICLQRLTSYAFSGSVCSLPTLMVVGSVHYLPTADEWWLLSYLFLPSSLLWLCHGNAFTSHILYMQSLIKKDREEQSKPEMLEFFSNLVTAYRDPALKPIRRASNSDERTAPLLASSPI